MRVALLTWDFPPVPTGLGQAAHEIACGLVEAGCEVTVFTVDRSGEEVAEGLRIVGCALPRGGPLPWLRQRAVIGHLAVPSQLAQAVRAEGPFDVIEATNWYAPAALLVGGDTPVVVRNSTPAIDAWTYDADLRDRADLRFAHWFEAKTARRANALISNAEHHRATISSLYGLPEDQPHEVIPLSLDPALVARGAASPPPRFEGAPRLLFVGRAERRKGFDELLRAFSDLVSAAEGDGAPLPELCCVGLAEDSLLERVNALGLPPEILLQIDDLGRASEAELHHAFGWSDMIVAPSRYESYGIVYREAAAFGRPLIACAADPSARSLIGEYPIGVLSERCTGRAIAAAVERVWRNPEGAAEMRAAGLDLARSLSRKGLGDATLSVYEAVVARTTQRRAA